LDRISLPPPRLTRGSRNNSGAKTLTSHNVMRLAHIEYASPPRRAVDGENRHWHQQDFAQNICWSEHRPSASRRPDDWIARTGMMRSGQSFTRRQRPPRNTPPPFSHVLVRHYSSTELTIDTCAYDGQTHCTLNLWSQDDTLTRLGTYVDPAAKPEVP
jgi:hypothetical protein